ncbi:hypothetical protein RHRU231_480021 [Rhodococcus ruber]|uniref:Uncharacterized protein n=1 Tax=Rhodococcus ruber TaxID=1830 RepID=A0A098BL91_9NOCA|nr:hypothetical protein RHRU231_480021 [Rhodococcus ruber]
MDMAGARADGDVVVRGGLGHAFGGQVSNGHGVLLAHRSEQVSQ